MNTDYRLARTRFLERIYNRYADAIIAIDNNVRYSLPKHPYIRVVHNGLTLDPDKDQTDSILVSKLNAIKKKKLTLGFAGVLDQNKGIFELIEAVKKCKDQGMEIDLLLLGLPQAMGKGVLRIINGKLFGNNNSQFSVDEFIEQLNVKDIVYRLGFSQDIRSFYSSIDVICFPSYYDAPGRPVFEGAFFSKPSILAVSKPQEDSFIQDVTGRQVIAGDSNSIFNAIKFYYDNPEKIREHGNNARALALKNFDVKKNALEVLDIYQILLSKTSS